MRLLRAGVLVIVSACGSSYGDDAGGDAPPSSTSDPSIDTWTWSGFEHEWLREVSGFRVPHRVSKLTTRVQGASFTFGQDTGVDGNFMAPVGHAQRLRGKGLGAVDGQIDVAWTDDADDSTHPRAVHDETATLSIDLGSTVLAGRARYAVVLRGIELETTCDPAKQPVDRPCDSNGIWPYVFDVDLGAPSVVGSRLTCSVTLAIHRAWTPNRGGLPGVAEKALNDKIDVRLRIGVTVIGGSERMLAVTRGEDVRANGNVRDDVPKRTNATIDGSGASLPTAFVGVGGFGFRLSPSESGERFQHLGRYIGALRFGVENVRRRPGGATFDALTSVWVPDTVERSAVDYRLRPILLEIGEGIETTAVRVSGRVCQNSDGAPSFSTFMECGSEALGPERDTDTVPLSP